MKCILKLKSDHFYYARGSHVSSGKSGASAGEVTDAPDDPQTPIQTTGSRQLQTTPLSIKSSTGQNNQFWVQRTFLTYDDPEAILGT